MFWIVFVDENFYKTEHSINHKRGNIYDRNGNLLATTIETQSIYCDPMKVPQSFYTIIQDEFKVNLNKAVSRRSRFLWLERHVEEARYHQIKEKRIPGVYAKVDHLREYPSWKTTSSLLGFCDFNCDGKHGVEYGMNSILKKQDVILSIDLDMQNTIVSILNQCYQDFSAEGASGVIVDIVTGRIRAMVSIPTPLIRADFLCHEKRNRNLDPVEVGSILKVLNVAIALETGQYNLDSIVDARGPLLISKFEINDFLGVNCKITLKESLWRSSNIANARVALDLGKQVQKLFFKKVGLLDRIEWMPQCYACPLLPKKWGKTTVATLAYGHGLGMTTLHLAQVLLAVTTGNIYPLTLLEKANAGIIKKVFSKNTVEQIRESMYEVVNKSTRKALVFKKCKIGAKTGTANLVINGQYAEGRNFVTLATVFPIDRPRLLVIMQMTDPKKDGLTEGNYTTAGNVLPRYMRKVVAKLLKYYLD